MNSHLTPALAHASAFRCGPVAGGILSPRQSGALAHNGLSLGVTAVESHATKFTIVRAKDGVVVCTGYRMVPTEGHNPILDIGHRSEHNFPYPISVVVNVHDTEFYEDPDGFLCERVLGGSVVWTNA